MSPLNFDGLVRIYLLEPVSPGPSQESASILPLSDAVRLKNNLSGLYGDPVEKDGVFSFAVPQGLLDKDKMLLLKIVKDKALLAPSAAISEAA